MQTASLEALTEVWQTDLHVQFTDVEWSDIFCIRTHSSSVCTRHGCIDFKSLRHADFIFLKSESQKMYPPIDHSYRPATFAHTFWFCPKLLYLMTSLRYLKDQQIPRNTGTHINTSIIFIYVSCCFSFSVECTTLGKSVFLLYFCIHKKVSVSCSLRWIIFLPFISILLYLDLIRGAIILKQASNWLDYIRWLTRGLVIFVELISLMSICNADSFWGREQCVWAIWDM